MKCSKCKIADITGNDKLCTSCRGHLYPTHILPKPIPAELKKAMGKTRKKAKVEANPWTEREEFWVAQYALKVDVCGGDLPCCEVVKLLAVKLLNRSKNAIRGKLDRQIGISSNA